MTGLPRPPHAPDSLPNSNGDGILDLSVAPQPPTGQGRTLAYQRPTLRWLLMSIVWAVLLVVAVTTVTLLFPSLSVFQLIFVWLMPLLAIGQIVHLFWSAKRTVAAAGADWYSLNGRWVRTYELTEVKLIKRGRAGSYLRLVDSEGRTIETGYVFMRKNRLIWDLVYNGMLHSVIAGKAMTNMRLHSEVGLPYATS